MTDEQRERMLDRLLENQAHHEATLRKLEESYAHHDVFLRKLEEHHWDHDAVLRRLEESQEHHDAVLRKLEELQMANQVAIGRLNGQLAAFAEQHHAALLEIDNRLIRLEGLLEVFIRGSRHNGGSQES